MDLDNIFTPIHTMAWFVQKTKKIWNQIWTNPNHLEPNPLNFVFRENTISNIYISSFNDFSDFRSNMDKSKSFRAASSAKPITHHHHQHKSSTAAFLDRHRTTSEGNTQFDIKRYILFYFKFRFFQSKHNIQFLYFVI